ncbi:MAG TPA: AAA family ATPase [Acidimicrobiales bacterium]|nr:AAA family ATPase [Acidimicrobiales bacterium]
MPEVLTVLRVDIAGDDAVVDRVRDRVRALVEESGGTVAHGAFGPDGLVATFHLAGEAAAAALRVAHDVAPGAPRLSLSTGEVEPGPGGPRGVARERVDALAGLADRTGDAPVLMTASTTVMVSHALPPGVEVVDRGVATLGRHAGERVYELRVAAPPTGDSDTGASNLAWAHRAAARDIVGRDEPGARLLDAWARAREGRHPVVVVSGDPGIGKTSLAAELALRVHAAGGTVIYGRWDEEGLTPYQALREALGSYAAACPRALIRSDVAAHVDDLARLIPDLGARIGGVRPPLVDDPDAERLRLFDAVRDWIGAIARRRPVLAVLDDLQWADHSSLLLVRHLLDSPPAGPVLVVVTLRDGEVEGMGPLHTLGSFAGADVERVELAGLPPGDVAELVARALGRPADGPEVAAAEWLADETAGNPLFVHEILRGLDPGDPGRALLAARDRLPPRVHDLVRWRLARLPEPVDEALGAASLIGEEFSLDVLSAIVGRTVLDLRHHLDGAVRAGVLRDVEATDRAAFAHAVVRRALQDEVPPDRARMLHRRIAETLAARAGDGVPAAEIARHYLLSADEVTAPLAVRWGRLAAGQARQETAFETAVWFLGRVVDVVDRFGADGRTPGGAPDDTPGGARDDTPGGARDVTAAADALACELRLDLADAHDRAGEFVARDRRYLEAADLARALDRTDLLVRAALGYGGRLPASPPSNPTARRLLTEALDRLPASDGRARALALARLAHVLHGDAPHAERKHLADEAEAMARRLDAPVVLASVLCSRVLALDGPDDVDEHLDIGEEVMRIGRHIGDTDLVLQGARARIHPLFVVGAHDAARDLADTFIQLADTVRHPDHLRLAAMWRTMWTVLEGRFDEAEAQADALRVRLQAAGHSQVPLIHLAQTMVIRWMRGTIGAVLPMFDAFRQHDPDALNLWALQAWAEAAAGHTARAEEVLAERRPADLAGADPGFQWLPTVVWTGLAATITAAPEWAAAVRDTLSPYSGRNCVMGYATYLGAVDQHLGMLDLVLGEAEPAVDHLAAALARHRLIDADPWIALSAAWLANALATRDGAGGGAGDGAGDDAADLYAESRSLAGALGLVSLPDPHPALAR